MHRSKVAHVPSFGLFDRLVVGALSAEALGRPRLPHGGLYRQEHAYAPAEREPS